ncbi:MAG TPA: hypothetical protein VHG93_14525 [Longimicrobium sp.]|nr:hypothetical protein [Longimicrobium sp.]
MPENRPDTRCEVRRVMYIFPFSTTHDSVSAPDSDRVVRYGVVQGRRSEPGQVIASAVPRATESVSGRFGTYVVMPVQPPPAR